MNKPTFNENGGIIPNLIKTVKDICNYIPSLEVHGDNYTTSVSKYSNGTIIHAKAQQTPSINRSTPVESESSEDEFIPLINQCHVSNSLTKYNTLSLDSNPTINMTNYILNFNGQLVEVTPSFMFVSGLIKEFKSYISALTEEYTIDSKCRVEGICCIKATLDLIDITSGYGSYWSFKPDIRITNYELKNSNGNYVDKFTSGYLDHLYYTSKDLTTIYTPVAKFYINNLLSDSVNIYLENIDTKPTMLIANTPTLLQSLINLNNTKLSGILN